MTTCQLSFFEEAERLEKLTKLKDLLEGVETSY